MRAQIIKIVLIAVVIVAVLLLVAYGYFGYAPAPEPPNLSATLQRSAIRVGQLNRTYTFYVPAQLPGNSALVFVLHGATQKAEDIRKFTGYEFERLADANGYVVVYPEGYEENWNDCRKSATYTARTLDIDDKGFIRALIWRFQQSFGIDPTRVFVAGYSNGGHQAYRLALELPTEITAIAAISANLPTPDNSDCRETRQAIPVLIMNGTADPINPYNGGEVAFYGFNSRGTVRSSTASARYFARLAGHSDAPDEVASLPHQNSSDPTSVRRELWRAPGKPEVVLYSIEGGGHVIPQTVYRAPRLLGRTTDDLNGPAEIWNFFARQPPTNKAMPPTRNRADLHQ